VVDLPHGSIARLSLGTVTQQDVQYLRGRHGPPNPKMGQHDARLTPPGRVDSLPVEEGLKTAIPVYG
jgi:hypothetical protein